MRAPARPCRWMERTPRWSRGTRAKQLGKCRRELSAVHLHQEIDTSAGQSPGTRPAAASMLGRNRMQTGRNVLPPNQFHIPRGGPLLCIVGPEAHLVANRQLRLLQSEVAANTTTLIYQESEPVVRANDGKPPHRHFSVGTLITAI